MLQLDQPVQVGDLQAGAGLFFGNYRVAAFFTNDISVIDLSSLREVDRLEAGIHPDGMGLISAG